MEKPPMSKVAKHFFHLRLFRFLETRPAIKGLTSLKIYMDYFSYKYFSGKVTWKSLARSRKLSGEIVWRFGLSHRHNLYKDLGGFLHCVHQAEVMSKSSPEQNIP